MVTKCPKCGGELVQTTPEIAKCKECGASFKRKSTTESEGNGKKCRKGKNAKKKGGLTKWSIVTFLALLLVGIGIGIGMQSAKPDNSNSSNDVETDINNNTEQTSVNNSNNLNAEIIAEYTLPDSIGWYTRRFMVVTNNSNETVHITTSSLAYGQDGAIVSTDDAEFHALGAGCTTVICEAFETAEVIDHYDTDMKVEKSNYYESVIQDLSYVQNDISGGAVFQVTNNGGEPAQYVQGCALFFMDDTLVGYEETYFVDDESELKPGQTISKQLTSYSDFNRIEFYLDGRK